MTVRESIPSRSSLADTVEQFAGSAEQALQKVRERVVPSATRWASQAEELAHRSVNTVRGQSEQLRGRAMAVSDRGIRYVKDEPLKAVLIAAAAGALLAFLLSPSSSSNGSESRRD